MESGNLRTLIRKFKLLIFNKIAPKCYCSFVFVYIFFLENVALWNFYEALLRLVETWPPLEVQ